MYNQYHSCDKGSEFILHRRLYDLFPYIVHFYVLCKRYPHTLHIHKIMRGSIQKKMQILNLKLI